MKWCLNDYDLIKSDLSWHHYKMLNDELEDDEDDVDMADAHLVPCDR